MTSQFPNPLSFRFPLGTCEHCMKLPARPYTSTLCRGVFVNPLVLEIDEAKTGTPLPEGRGRDVVPGGAVSTRPPSAPDVMHVRLTRPPRL